MAAVVPQIQVTDPNSKNVPTSPSPMQSPAAYSDGGSESARSQLEKSDTNGDTGPLSSGRTSPVSLRRNKSSGASAQSDASSPLATESEQRKEPQATSDPLTQNLIKRANLQNHNVNKVHSLEGSHSQSPTSPTDGSVELKLPTRTDTGTSTMSKDKKGRVSILSRLRGNKKKEGLDQENDVESEFGDSRPEGMDAELFSQPIDNIEFNPRHPQPPAYIKVRARNKKEKDFDRLFLAQELHGKHLPAKTRRGRNNSISSTTAPTAPGSGGTIWAMEFSKDGKYLAAAGQDKIVRVWAVLSCPEDRRAHEKEEEAGHESLNGHIQHLNAPVFQTKPVKEYQGHSSTILDLSWSKNNFLLSSSMDKTVRLWHISRPECLCTFKHNDFVPSIMFHPKDDRFFLAGSLDCKLRLWSIPDKSVAYMVQLPDMITAVTFTPDGKTSIVGCLSGLCLFYDTEGLKYQTQIHVRSAHGKNAKGSKITGIQAVNMPPHDANGEVKLLITSNDSRIRLYNLRDKSLEIKFKGNENNYSQIRASFSDDARYVICGSEDRKTYIWPAAYTDGDKPDKRPVEMFEAHAAITTTVIFAPTKTRQLLSSSEDPVYDICNPPPVQLVSRAESIDSKPATDTGSVQPTPVAAETGFKRPEENPTYLARSQHHGGNIIITADYAGKIKVFRQDCAFQKRRTDSWETGSVFSKRVTTGLGRTASIKTHGSGRSRRNSNPSLASSSDRILSWRQSINSTSNLDHPSPRQPARATRSTSPRKSLGQSSIRSGPLRSGNPGLAKPPSESTVPTIDGAPSNSSRPASLHTTTTSSTAPKPPTTMTTTTTIDSHSTPPTEPPPRQHSEASSSVGGAGAPPSPLGPSENPLWLQGAQSYLFWKDASWREQSRLAAKTAGGGSQGESGRSGALLGAPGAPLSKKMSVVSTLTDEDLSGEGSEQDGGGDGEKGRERGRGR
ncbi:MAG: hypothetical protein M1821_000342 [Bathelium mastoideum]|nr:MAG: hypothetical protein M1821_000342 [Bathelium mastoideum]